MRYCSGEARSCGTAEHSPASKRFRVPLPLADRPACKSVQKGVDYSLMLCQKCGLNKATIHRESAVFRQKIEEHLCELCAGVGAWISSAAMSGKKVSRKAGHLTITNKAEAARLGRKLEAMALALPPALGGLPKRIEVSRGLSANLRAVERLFEPKQNLSALFISTLAGQTTCRLSVRRKAEAAQLGIRFMPHSPPDAEAKVRKFFMAREIPLKREIGHATLYQYCHLLYPVSGRYADMASLAAELLKTCFSVQETDSLNFRCVRG